MSRRHVDFLRAAVVLAIAVGVAFRAINLIQRRSLWLDEAMLALNVTTRSFAELTQPLDQVQLAPVLFLWLERLVTQVGGVNETTLRLVPFACGVASLPLMFLVARRVVSPYAAAVAVCALAISPLMIYYSGEAKPYAVDMFTALALVWLAQRTLYVPARAGAWRLLFVVGIIAPWFSFTAMFVLPLIGLALLMPPATSAAQALPAAQPAEASRVRQRRALVLLAAWGASAMGSLMLASDPTITDAMNEYWRGSFLTLDLAGVRRAFGFTLEMIQIAVLGASAEQSLAGPGIQVFAPLASAVAALGILALARRELRLAVLVVGPVVAAYASSVAGKYPVASRLWLFAVSLILVTFVVGLEAAARVAPQKWRGWLTMAVAAFFLVPSFLLSLRFSQSPVRRQERAVIQALLVNLREGEPVYVFPRATSVWLFYSTDWPHDAPFVRPVLRAKSPPDGPAFSNAGVMGRLTPVTERILTRKVADRIEILGVSSGYRTSNAGSAGQRVAPEWAPAEVARIQRVGSPCVMLFSTPLVPEEEAAVLTQLDRLGGVERWRFELFGSRALRICFDRNAIPKA